jgi:hypothetical protein
MTLFTTPVIYIYFDKLVRGFQARRGTLPDDDARTVSP